MSRDFAAQRATAKQRRFYGRRPKKIADVLAQLITPAATAASAPTSCSPPPGKKPPAKRSPNSAAPAKSGAAHWKSGSPTQR